MGRSPGFWERFLLTERGPLARYGVALLLALASLGAAHLLQRFDVAGAGSIALATVVVSAIYGGLGPALLDGAVTAAGLEYLTEPVFVMFDSWDSWVRLLLHVVVGVLIADIGSSLRAAYLKVRQERTEAQAAKRAREEVLSIVSHDLRNPLAVIKLAVGSFKLERGRALDPDRLAPVERAVDQMQRIIGDVLDADRIEKGQFRIELAHHELAPIVDDAVNSVRALAEARRVEIAVRGQGAGVACDRARLTQVLANLVHNAVKFSPAGSTVEVSAAADAREVRVAVKDRGPGMDEQLMSRLFQRHWQAAGTAHRGTGLGLFIAKSIVEAHGGHIDVRSAPGAGATFTVRLPLR